MRGERRQLFRYLICDYLALNAGWMLFTLIRYLFLPTDMKTGMDFGAYVTMLPVAAGQVLVPVLMMGMYWLSGYYNTVFFKSRLDELVNTVCVTSVGTIFFFLAILINDMVAERMRNYEMLLLMWLMLFVPVYILRLVITTRAARRIRDRQILYNTLVIGTGQKARRLAMRMMQAERNNGFNIAAFIETSPHIREDRICDLPVYGLENISEAIAREHITRIIVMPHHSGIRDTSQLINSLFTLGCTIYVTPELYGVMVTRPRYGNVTGEPLIDISHVDTTAMTVNCKRVADVVLSAFALVILSPLYAALAVAVKRGSRGPVLYRQERIGYHKKPFMILKFRTMYCDAESNGPALSSLDDPRITPVGHFLRKYRLDELPQFWNVLKGDMSIVGPRPEREYYIRQIVERAPYYNLIHQVRPGITSWGMVKYGYATSVSQMIDRLRYDMVYIDNVSLAVDLKILFYTVHTVLTGKGL